MPEWSDKNLSGAGAIDQNSGQVCQQAILIV
jgi:hypothetical protein